MNDEAAQPPASILESVRLLAAQLEAQHRAGGGGMKLILHPDDEKALAAYEAGLPPRTRTVNSPTK